MLLYILLLWCHSFEKFCSLISNNFEVSDDQGRLKFHKINSVDYKWDKVACLLTSKHQKLAESMTYTINLLCLVEICVFWSNLPALIWSASMWKKIVCCSWHAGQSTDHKCHIRPKQSYEIFPWPELFPIQIVLTFCGYSIAFSQIKF